MSGAGTHVGIVYEKGRWEITIPGLSSPRTASSLDEALKVAWTELQNLNMPAEVSFYVRIGAEDLREYVNS